VTCLQVGADDTTIDAIGASDKAGIDCPLGWPTDFVSFVNAHQSGDQYSALGVTGSDLRRALSTRTTDRVVRKETGLVPLSVAVDHIGYVAIRCSELLAQLALNGQPVDRSGSGTVVEVYPAASLARWDLSHRGYKGSPRGVFEMGHYGRVLRYVLLRDALRNLSLEPSAGCRAVNHLGLTGSDPMQG